MFFLPSDGFSNKIERHPENGSQFSYAIVAVPRYPHPRDLTESIKVEMIFNTFDKDGDDYLNEVEMTMWQAILKKPEEVMWDETVAFYLNTYGVVLDYDKGMDKAIVKSENDQQPHTISCYKVRMTSTPFLFCRCYRRLLSGVL